MTSSLFIALTETDKRALIILCIVAVIAFFIIALIGVAIRRTMAYQAKRAGTMMHDATVTYVVNTPQEFRKLAYKKSNRILYRQTLAPFLLCLVGLLIWIISNIVTKKWGENLWAIWSELFFEYDWTGCFVKVFGMTLISDWPAVSRAPVFHVEHLPEYVEVAFFLVSGIYFAVVCQAYFSRFMWIQTHSRSIYEKSLEGFKANEDIKITPEQPLPPSD